MTGIQVLRPREVPLGGPRSMTVRRTLPHRDRSFIGAWCFVDHYGPDEVATTGGMELENRYGLLRCLSQSMISRLPLV